MITGNDYQQAALRTAGNNDLDALLLNGVMGLNGEAGECIDMVKKAMFQGHALDTEKLAKELGDVAWYLAVAAYAINYDLDTVLEMNIEKLKARYPDGFDAERSNNRKED
jgi:NTP pyrophosphatase (non-canonical NTP hydrolase)